MSKDNREKVTLQTVKHTATKGKTSVLSKENTHHCIDTLKFLFEKAHSCRCCDPTIRPSQQCAKLNLALEFKNLVKIPREVIQSRTNVAELCRQAGFTFSQTREIQKTHHSLRNAIAEFPCERRFNHQQLQRLHLTFPKDFKFHRQIGTYIRIRREDTPLSKLPKTPRGAPHHYENWRVFKTPISAIQATIEGNDPQLIHSLNLQK